MALLTKILMLHSPDPCLEQACSHALLHRNCVAAAGELSGSAYIHFHLTLREFFPSNCMGIASLIIVCFG